VEIVFRHVGEKEELVRVWEETPVWTAGAGALCCLWNRRVWICTRARYSTH
jgi:hypothetical protein